MESITCIYYRVAGHLFAVECKQPELLCKLSNYAPFISPEPTESPLFLLRIQHEDLIADELRSRYTHVFTDTSDADMPRIEVYRSSLENASLQFRGGEWLFRVAIVANAPICCELESNEDFSDGILHIAADCQDIKFCIDNALMLMYAFRTAPLMTLEMHAAVVVRGSLQDGAERLQDAASGYRTGRALQDASLQVRGEDRGYLFLGYSGTGKSTHARMWIEAFADAWLLNDDNPILRVMEDGEVRVYGSPWSGKTPCYKNEYVRVGGIVKLSQAPHNKLRKISLPEAYAYILSSSSGLKIESGIVDGMHETIKHVITQVGCYHLDCLPNTEAAEVCWGELTGDPHQLPLQGGE